MFEAVCMLFLCLSFSVSVSVSVSLCVCSTPPPPLNPSFSRSHCYSACPPHHHCLFTADFQITRERRCCTHLSKAAPDFSGLWLGFLSLSLFLSLSPLLCLAVCLPYSLPHPHRSLSPCKRKCSLVRSAYESTTGGAKSWVLSLHCAPVCPLFLFFLLSLPSIGYMQWPNRGGIQIDRPRTNPDFLLSYGSGRKNAQRPDRRCTMTWPYYSSHVRVPPCSLMRTYLRLVDGVL